MGCVLAGALAPAAVAAGSQQPASLGALACRQASDPLSRLVGISATMRPIPGTERMAMRFQLLERTPGSWFHQVHGGDLGRWTHPNPPTFGQQPGDTWVVNKPVANLGAPAIYRFRVTFRWVAADGVITTAVRLSPLCAEAR